MHWLHLRAHWSELQSAMHLAFPNMTATNTQNVFANTDEFARQLAAAHELTISEVGEIIEDIVLQALCNRMSKVGQTRDVTQRMVASS